MNLQSLVVVFLRLMSLNLLIQSIFMVMSQMLMIADVRGMTADILVPGLVVVGLSVVIVLLWSFAPILARWITRGSVENIQLGGLSLGDCYSVMFIGIGLYKVIGYLAPVLNWLLYLLKSAAVDPGGGWKRESIGYNSFATFFPFIIGIILFVNGRKWGVALARRHTGEATPLPPSGPDPRFDDDVT